MAEGGAALGKGAWDCDNNRLIPPEKEVRLLPLLQARARRRTAAAQTSVNGAPLPEPIP